MSTKYTKCRICGSEQFNLRLTGIDQGCLCDVHYWKERAQSAEAHIINTDAFLDHLRKFGKKMR